MSFLDLPDEIILIVAEYVANNYRVSDKIKFVNFYKVNKRFYQFSNYYVMRCTDNEVCLFSPKSWHYICNYKLINNGLTHYEIWNLKPLQIKIDINLYSTTIYNKDISYKEKRELLKIICDMLPDYMKNIHKPVTLSSTPFPLFDDFIINYLQ